VTMAVVRGRILLRVRVVPVGLLRDPNAFGRLLIAQMLPHCARAQSHERASLLFPIDPPKLLSPKP
jgi:hypothetical protein